MSERWPRRRFLASAGAAAAGAALGCAHAAAPSVAAPVPVPVPPPPAGGALTVLFQGDSITDGGRNRGAAQPNVNGALGPGYPFLIAADALAAQPERQLLFFNRGVSGDKVPDLARRWRADTIALDPDIVSVLVGVNDFWHRLLRGYAGTVADYESGYTQLLEDTRRAIPRVRLVVLEPFVLRTGAVDARWFPEFDDRRAAAARVARAAGATFIPLQSVFDRLTRHTPPAHWAADGVHPTPAGHAVIARQWRGAVRL